MLKRILLFIRQVGWVRGLLVVGGVIVGVMLVSAFAGKSVVATNPISNISGVTLDSVAHLSTQNSSLSLGGTVVSKSEATVRPEVSGAVTAVYHALGDTVAAGTIVAEMENTSQRAAVAQAQAQLDKVTGGSRTEQRAILDAGLAAAQQGAVASLLSAYAATENAIRGTTDAMFSNPDNAAPRFNVTSSETQAVLDVQNTRVTLGATLVRENARAQTLSVSDDLIKEIATTQDELRTVRSFLDSIVTALNKGIATESISVTTLATYSASASAARTTVTGAISSLSAAQQALVTAQNNLKQGVVGGQPEDVSSAEATLASARATLEKTIIRAPISGTINSFSLKQGDFVTAMTPVLTVANNYALEVVSYVTDTDAREIAVGGKAMIDDTLHGTVTRIAPALDPLTKKIEVRIGITDITHSLINGQSVTISLARNHVSTSATPTRLTIPLSALKIGASEVDVFTVSASSTLLAHPVTLGTLLGERVEITAGLTPEMTIVTDARGLQNGQTVTVDAQ